jgi:dihydrolipoamide dehydrogenase
MSISSFDLVIIGSGPGGYVAALRAGQLGLKTACVEKDPKLGGTCLNVGCIPSKALLHSSEIYWKLSQEGKQEGILFDKLGFDFSIAMQRKQKIVAGFNDGVAMLFKKNKVTRLQGEAHFLSERQIQVGDQTIEAKFFIIATGSESIALPFLPFDERQVLSSTGALALEAPPRSLLVIGAGIIGVELGSVYARLGTKVTFIEFLDRICSTHDESLSKALQEALTQQGLTFHLSSKVTQGQVTPSQVTLKVGEETFQAEKVLVAIGRRPYTRGLNLEAIGIQLSPKGFIPIDGFFRTIHPHIFAIGDVVDGPMLAHKASEEGVVVTELIAGHRSSIEYMAIPNVIYTYPEVASVGFMEAEAKSYGLAIKVGTFFLKANSRARCTGETEGFVKIIAEAATDRIIGVHIISAHASELIAEGALAIQNKLTASDIIATIHAHPTLSESTKEAALDIYRRALHK